MEENRYTPHPIDTSAVEVPEELSELMEKMARNVHEVWAAGRMSEGWTLGPRNDELRQHPCLIPYDELSEEEKNYDRNTALSTLKLIISLGFRIEK